MMPRAFSLVFRILIFLGITCFLPAVLVFLGFAAPARTFVAAFTLGILLVGVFLLFTFSEWILIRRLRALPTEGPELIHSVRRALSPWYERKRLPDLQICVYSDSNPNVLVARSLFSQGTLLLSRGFLQLLDEREIRAVVQQAERVARRRSLVFQTGCVILAATLMDLAPRSWTWAWTWVMTGAAFGRLPNAKIPASALEFSGFLFLYPWVRAFLLLGTGPERGPASGVRQQDAHAPYYFSGIRKMKLFDFTNRFPPFSGAAGGHAALAPLCVVGGDSRKKSVLSISGAP